jgi:hypothetical protein
MIVSNPTHVADDEKPQWKDTKFQSTYIKKWMESLSILEHGPASVLKPDDCTVNIRDMFMEEKSMKYCLVIARPRLQPKGIMRKFCSLGSIQS